MYIIQARALNNLQAFFYTGRAGSGWLDTDRAEAFRYDHAGYATKQARAFAKRHRAFIWTVLEADRGDAHAAGAAAMSAEACGEW